MKSDKNMEILGSPSDYGVWPQRTVTGSTTALTTENVIYVNNTTDVAVNMPAASLVTGRIYIIKKISNTPAIVTIIPNSAETIDDSDTVVISRYNEGIGLQSDGNNWRIVIGYPVNNNNWTPGNIVP